MPSKEARDLEEALAWDDVEDAYFSARYAEAQWKAKKLAIAEAYQRQIHLVEMLTEMLEDESERLKLLGELLVKQID